jgi:hypothetical protein
VQDGASGATGATFKSSIYRHFSRFWFGTLNATFLRYWSKFEFTSADVSHPCSTGEFQNMRLSACLVAAVTLIATFTLAAHADTVDFSYSGSNSENAGIIVTGAGSFDYSGSPSNLTLADLTDFSYTETIVAPGTGTGSFTYVLPELTSFSATFNAGALLTLSLQTDFVGSSDNINFFPESFTITDLTLTGSNTTSQVPEGLGTGIAITSTGQTTIISNAPAVPEPSTFALFGTGILALAGTARRKLLLQS